MKAVLVTFAVLLARVGWRRPAFSLVIPAATLVNAAAPGAYTAALLYLPSSSSAFVGAAHDGVSRSAITTAVAAGTVMAIGVVLAARWFSDATYSG